MARICSQAMMKIHTNGKSPRNNSLETEPSRSHGNYIKVKIAAKGSAGLGAFEQSRKENWCARRTDAQRIQEGLFPDLIKRNELPNRN